MKYIIAFFWISFAQLAIAQTDRDHVRSGNEYYKLGELDSASAFYNKALEQNAEMLEAQFNLADATYEQGNYEEAAKQFGTLAESATSKEQKAKAYHNLGNSFLKAKKYKESVEAFKNALRNNPADEDTRWNFEFARRKLKEQQQQQNKDQQDNKDNQDNKDKKDQKDQQNKDNKEDNKDNKEDNKDKNKDKKNEEKDNKDKNKDQQNKDEQQDKKDEQKDQQKGDQNEDQKDQQQQKPQPNQMSKEDAQRLLNALKNKEQKTQDKVKKVKVKANRVKIEKDW